MVTQKLQESRWRIEERAVSNGTVLGSAGHDDPDRAFQSFTAWRRYLAVTAAREGKRSPLRPYGDRRLVLIDRETHVIAPRSVVEGPAL